MCVKINAAKRRNRWTFPYIGAHMETHKVVMQLVQTINDKQE